MQLVANFKGFLLIIFLFFVSSLSAEGYDKQKSYFDHLCEINSEWSSYKEACPKGNASFSFDIDRIQLHLNLVVKYLRLNQPIGLNSVQLSNRNNLLDTLQIYADKRIYPLNTYHNNRQPYFVDLFGTNCAVGQMIYSTGHKDLVNEISERYNYKYIEEIKIDGVIEWANEYGFTLEELKWIQPNYLPIEEMAQVAGGTNGNVTKVNQNIIDGSLTIIGEFTELDNLSCLNIGVYQDNQLSCLGEGVEGIINDIVYKWDEIYIFGDLISNGESFTGAMFDGIDWIYFNIPDRNGATGTSAYIGGSSYEFEVVISHTDFIGYQEIWYLLSDGTWERKAKIRGVILDIEASVYGRVHVGHLDSVMIFNSINLVDTLFKVNNVLFKSNNSSLWYGTEGYVSDTINVVTRIGGALIFGGTCSSQPNSNNVCISRYFNSTLQPLLLNNFTTDNVSINTIAYDSGSKFVFGGHFDYFPLVGTYGSNLATYDLIGNSVKPIAVLDRPVNSAVYFDDKLYIGGGFQSNLTIPTQSINYLARQADPVGTNELISGTTINVYPIPFTTWIDLKGVDNGSPYSILSVDGRIMQSGVIVGEKINNLDNVPNGIFVLKVELSNGFLIKKIIK